MVFYKKNLKIIVKTFFNQKTIHIFTLSNNATRSKAERYSLVHYEVQIESQTIVFIQI